MGNSTMSLCNIISYLKDTQLQHAMAILFKTESLIWLFPFVCLSVSQNCSSIRFANKNSVCYAILTTTNTFFRDTHSQNSLSFLYRYCPLSSKKISEQDTLFAISVWCENCKYKQPLYNSV